MAETQATTAAAATPAQPKLTLFWLDKSRSHRIAWLLEELKLPYEVKTYKRGKDMLAPKSLKEIHPLGHAPLLQVLPVGADKPITLAESGNIVEFLAEHFGKQLIPQQYQQGKEGLAGGETEAYLRYRYIMHYAEGSLMALLVICLVNMQIRNAPVPFFIKPILRIISGRVDAQFLTRNVEANFALCESMLTSAPAGDYFCGSEVTSADIMMIFPLEASLASKLAEPAKYPKIAAWVERVHAREAYKAASARMEKESGEKVDMSF